MPRTLPVALFVGALLCCGLQANAQCDAGELEVTIEVNTDAYGNETYWQLVPSGNACGTGTIFSGGNNAVGCNGGGNLNSPAGGYANNANISTGPWCLAEGTSYDIISVDSYGDDQAEFEVFVNGATIGTYVEPGATNIFTFVVHMPEARDMGVVASTTSIYSEVGSTVVVKGTVRNFGLDAVTSYDLSYRIGSGPVQTDNITGVNIPLGGEALFIHDINWNPSAAGSQELHVWTTNINGNSDLYAANDTLDIMLVVNPAIPNIIDDYLEETPEFVQVANSDNDLLVPRDLDFHPDRTRNELWVLNKDVESSGGSTVRFTNAGEGNMDFEWQRDANAWHFMSLPTAIAMADNGNFATSPGVFDANHNGGTPFTGPTLWSSDPAIYAQNLFGPLGSHLDMVHVNPNSQGIAHDQWNRFWVVDGYNGDIVMNDFRGDHGPGNDYHGNAIIRRYSEFEITKDPNDHIVSHCVLDKNTGWLYVVDHGGQRVMRLDINTGEASGPGNYGPWENYVEYSQMTGYTWQEVISTGLDKPAGIDVIGNRLLVSDHANGDIVVYDISGSTVPEIGRIHTGAAGIMGIKVAPDGKLWYVNATGHTLVRIDPATITAVEDRATAQPSSLYPNPVSDLLFITGQADLANANYVDVLDATGRTCLRSQVGQLRRGLDVSSLAPGQYAVRVDGMAAQRIVVAR